MGVWPAVQNPAFYVLNDYWACDYCDPCDFGGSQGDLPSGFRGKGGFRKPTVDKSAPKSDISFLPFGKGAPDRIEPEKPPDKPRFHVKLVDLTAANHALVAASQALEEAARARFAQQQLGEYNRLQAIRTAAQHRAKVKKIADIVAASERGST